MNPFEQKPIKLEETLMDWNQMRPTAYDKRAVDPYTRTRLILMNGTEFENVWSSHQFSRHCGENDLRRRLALLRRSEQHQQKFLSALKPLDETVLEHTIGYEQLAVDLTAELAMREPNDNVRRALNFALLEDFDHLYRYADLLDMEGGEKAEDLVGGYTEIMPGRPTIAHHRHPYDSIRGTISGEDSLESKLAVQIITAAEQQTMNYYMNVCATYTSERGRQLYQEIGMVEEQHVTQYGSLMDPAPTFLENLLMHQYTEAYLYWSCAETESDPRVKEIWNMLLEMEIAHLHEAKALLLEYEGKPYQQVIGGDGTFPEALALKSNIPYVREILKDTAWHTAVRESYADVSELKSDFEFFKYQKRVNDDLSSVRSHTVIEDHMHDFGEDYRFETAPNPVKELRDRQSDNIRVGRKVSKEAYARA